MLRRKNRKIDGNQKIKRFDCRVEQSGAENHVNVGIFCLLLR